MIILILTIALYLSFCLGNGRTKRMIRKNTGDLKSFSEEASPSMDHEQPTKDLPEPVLRYFAYSPKEPSPAHRVFHLEYSGKYRTREDREWRNLEGEIYYSLDPPGYFLKAKTTLFTYTDLFLPGKRQTRTYPLNLIPIGHREEDESPLKELPYWLAGISFSPLNFLPGKNLSWTYGDHDSAGLHLEYGGVDLSLLVTFSERGAMTKMRILCPAEQGSYPPWIIGFSGYEERNGLMVPTGIEIYWENHGNKHMDVRLGTLRNMEQ